MFLIIIFTFAPSENFLTYDRNMPALCTYFLKTMFDFKSAIKRVSIYSVPPYVDKGIDEII